MRCDRPTWFGGGFAESRRLRQRWSCLAAALLLAGCATSEPKQTLVLTGNVLTDGPEAISRGPARDRVLWQYRTAAAAMRQGDFGSAKRYLDDALLTIAGIFGKDDD